MRHFLLWAMAVVMLTACAEDGLNEVSGTKPMDEAPETLIASFEDDDTRIQLNDELRTVWTEGDLVSVFYRSDANQKWQYTGQTGARVGELKRVDAGTATTPTTRVVVVYPYNASYYFNTETYNVQASLPAVQTYLSGSYGVDGNILVSSGEYNQISLKSVCGWLKLQLTGDGEKVRSITLRGNNGEQVAGELYINTSDATAQLASAMGGSDDGDVGGAGGGLIFEDTILKEVTLNCGEGVELGAEATAFYIALPPQTFDGGITVEISTTDGATMTKSTDNSIVIERNHIQPMAAFKFVNPNTPTIPTPANNEIWYTATAKVEPYNTDEFGATYLSNVWDSETGKGVITFEGDVTKIGYYAFFSCDSLTSVTIPDSVTTIGERAFSNCDSLTSVTIPDSVKTIGEEAFSSCSKLTSVTIPDSVTTIVHHAFWNCESLTSVTIGNSVTTIGESAFYNCKSLTSVTIGNSVTTIGDYAFNGCTKLTSVTIPDSVTTIGKAAFSGCHRFKEFKGKFAADGGRCLIIDGVLNAFAMDCGVTQYTIPDSVTTIGERAFYECDSLTSVNIPDSVTTVGKRAFSNCDSLTSVTIPDSVKTIGSGAFSYCYNLTSMTIPDSVTTIGSSAFESCTSLTSVTIPDSVTTIGERAFYYCTSLKTVYCKPTTPPAGGDDMFDYNAAGRRIFVPASDDDSIIKAYKAKKYWSNYPSYIFEEGPANNEIWYTNGSTTEPTAPYAPAAFGDATIQSNSYDAEKECWVITFDKDVTEIGYNAFYNCTSLTSVTIPDSVTTIGISAFKSCTSLTSVTIPDSVTTIGDGAFYNCRSLTSVTIPDSVTTIGNWAFNYCKSLTSVTIPDSVTTIGNYAFYSCTSLKEFKGKFAADNGRCLIKDNTIIAYAEASGTTYTIPDSVTTIGDYAFWDCGSLTSVTIPNSVTTIGDYAFNNCISLKAVYCKPTTPPTGGIYMFDGNAAGRRIYVPASDDNSIINAYKEASRWSDYADYIFEEE